jgi:TPR repeat protein
LVADGAERERQLFAEAMAKRNAGQSTNGLRVFRQDADLGDTRAMVELGQSYMEDREGAAKDYREAMQWFRKAADAGNPSGMLFLGLCITWETAFPRILAALAFVNLIWPTLILSFGPPA